MLLEQRGDDGMWSGMWQPPTIETTRRLSRAGLLAAACEGDVPVVNVRRRATFRHQTTHRRITFHVFDGEAAPGSSALRSMRWQPLAALAEVAMSNAHRKAVRLGVQD